jgi:hypothetical protein
MNNFRRKVGNIKILILVILMIRNQPQFRIYDGLPFTAEDFHTFKIFRIKDTGVDLKTVQILNKIIYQNKPYAQRLNCLKLFLNRRMRCRVG